MGIRGAPPINLLDVKMRAWIIRGVLSAITRETSTRGRWGTAEDRQKRVALAEVEGILVVQEALRERVEQAVVTARRNGATWSEIAAVTGHGSRGAAARHFDQIRVSESETSTASSESPTSAESRG